MNRPTQRQNESGAIQEGLVNVIQVLRQHAPQYFGNASGEGLTTKQRVVSAVAAMIIGGEVTGELSRYRSSVGELFGFMGGSGNKMRGPFQFHTKYFGNRTRTIAEQAILAGQMLSGERELPTGKRKFPINDLVARVNRGEITNSQQLMAYLQRTISKVDWEGLFAAGASRIKAHGLDRVAFSFIGESQNAIPSNIASVPSSTREEKPASGQQPGIKEKPRSNPVKPGVNPAIPNEGEKQVPAPTTPLQRLRRIHIVEQEPPVQIANTSVEVRDPLNKEPQTPGANTSLRMPGSLLDRLLRNTIEGDEKQKLPPNSTVAVTNNELEP